MRCRRGILSTCGWIVCASAGLPHEFWPVGQHSCVFRYGHNSCVAGLLTSERRFLVYSMSWRLPVPGSVPRRGRLEVEVEPDPGSVDPRVLDRAARAVHRVGGCALAPVPRRAIVGPSSRGRLPTGPCRTLRGGAVPRTPTESRSLFLRVDCALAFPPCTCSVCARPLTARCLLSVIGDAVLGARRRACRCCALGLLGRGMLFCWVAAT